MSILQINAGENLKDTGINKPWVKNLDSIFVANQGAKYKVKADGVWKGDYVTA